MYTKPSASEIIIRERGRFLAEIIIIFIGILILNLIPYFLLPILIDTTSTLYAPLFFLLRVLSCIIAIPLFLIITNEILGWQKRKVILKQDEKNPAISHLKLYSIGKKNAKYQLLYGLLILFLVFIPLDFIFYWLIPDTIDYSFTVLQNNPELSAYLVNSDYLIFLISTITIHVSVAFYEETIARGLMAKRGNDYFHRMSAVMISSFYFGLGHFTYFFTLSSWIPLLWFLQTFIVGIILSLFFLRKKWLFPLIFAHALNNIISSHTLWNYPNDFSNAALYLYTPLLVISVVLFIWQYSRIKAGIKTGINDFRHYFRNNKKIKESSSDKLLRIFLDFLIAIMIFIVGIIVIL
ncbi:MAG: CPBP family intramembrane metalloprotease [Candidatus Lokiarchaeota archaeon]|nr:CPBP family intramembrane metalloprotease [Candidatus Lokiarchaeota archaeon]